MVPARLDGLLGLNWVFALSVRLSECCLYTLTGMTYFLGNATLKEILQSRSISFVGTHIFKRFA
jgi:hypothetical protein